MLDVKECQQTPHFPNVFTFDFVEPFAFQALKEEFELGKQALQELDQTTRVPHLLIEIRSVGFVEIQGKDTGGIYKRLEAQLWM